MEVAGLAHPSDTAGIRHYFAVICKAFNSFYKEYVGMFESCHSRISSSPPAICSSQGHSLAVRWMPAQHTIRCNGVSHIVLQRQGCTQRRFKCRGNSVMHSTCACVLLIKSFKSIHWRPLVAVHLCVCVYQLATSAFKSTRLSTFVFTKMSGCKLFDFAYLQLLTEHLSSVFKSRSAIPSLTPRGVFARPQGISCL